MALAYVGAVRLSARLARLRVPLARLVALFALPLVPIACGYHFAHYLPVFLVDVQYAIRAASDPLARGWDLFGTRDLAVVTSFLSDPERVYAIWHSQVALIVGAHVAGVVIGHALALRLAGQAPDDEPAADARPHARVHHAGTLAAVDARRRLTNPSGPPVESAAWPCYKGPAS